MLHCILQNMVLVSDIPFKGLLCLTLLSISNTNYCSKNLKPEHLEKYPNLHELIWNANKLAGANKQGVSSDSAKKLVESVDEIAKIFWATKGVTYSDPVADVRFGA